MNEKPSILILFAHPNRETSRIHQALLESVGDLTGITVVDLYQEYPDFLINVKREQERLLNYDLLVFQHPIYWYSCPPLLKEWMDCVLENGWAYGEGGTALRGLNFLQVLTSGGPDSAYLRSGYNRFTIAELMRPFEATATICGWIYHEPFLIQGVKAVSSDQLAMLASQYRALLESYLHEGGKVLKPFDSVQHS